MPYSTVDQIQEESRAVEFSSTSKPTEDTVTRWIQEADAEIDAAISSVYSTPITSSTSPESYKVLRMISIWLVTQRLKDFLEIKSTVDDVEQKSSNYQSRLDTKARKLLEKIANRDVKLTDATQAKSGGRVSSFNVSNQEEHTFKKNVDQW